MPSFSQHNWRYDEVFELLSIRAESDIGRQVSGTVKDSVVYEHITRRLRDRQIFRTKPQVTNKLKMLKRHYHQIVKQNGDEAKTWPFFSLCEAVWGSGKSASAVTSSKKQTTTLRSRKTQPGGETDASADESDSSPENLDTVDQDDILDVQPSTPESSQHRAPDTDPTLHSHDKPSTSTEELWSDQETHTMLNLLKQQKNENYNRSNGRNNVDIFRILSEGMAERGFRRSEGQIRTKWSSLKQSYKAAVSNQIDGSGPGQCMFFATLKELLGDQPIASSNGVQEGIDADLHDDAPSQDGSFINSVDPNDNLDRSLTAVPLCDIPSEQSPQEGPSRKRRRLNNGSQSDRLFLEQLQTRQQSWFANQMRPFHQREDRMLTLLESLVNTSERMVDVMTDCLKNINQQQRQRPVVPKHHRKTSCQSSAPTEDSFQDEDFFGLA